jgi:hypothetical protein
VTVTSPAATTDSTILLTPLSSPGTCTFWIKARAAGSFTISASIPLANDVVIQYLIIN